MYIENLRPTCGGLARVWYKRVFLLGGEMKLCCGGKIARTGGTREIRVNDCKYAKTAIQDLCAINIFSDAIKIYKHVYQIKNDCKSQAYKYCFIII